MKDGDSVSLEINKTQGWVRIRGIVHYSKNKDADVAVIEQDYKADSNDFVFSSDGSVLGQDCFFIGYPLGITTDRLTQANGIKAPIIKKGIISSSIMTKTKAIYFLIDGNNTYGLSGSPVIFYNYAAKKFQS